jgi:hypothetical protein
VHHSADHPRASKRLRLAIAGQAALLLAPGTLAFAPPVHGAMLLVPLLPVSASAVERVGLGAGATLGGVGPLPRSRFVDGDRARLLPAALHHGMIVVSASPRICGQFTGTVS